MKIQTKIRKQDLVLTNAAELAYEHADAPYRRNLLYQLQREYYDLLSGGKKPIASTCKSLVAIAGMMYDSEAGFIAFDENKDIAKIERQVLNMRAKEARK